MGISGSMGAVGSGAVGIGVGVSESGEVGSGFDGSGVVGLGDDGSVSTDLWLKKAAVTVVSAKILPLSRYVH